MSQPCGWVLQDPVLHTVAWSLAILVVLVPLTVPQHQRRPPATYEVF